MDTGAGVGRGVGEVRVGGEGGGDGTMTVLYPAQPAPAPIVLLTAHATLALQLPEARFGIAQVPSYTPMMDKNEREYLDTFCLFADGNPRRLKRIINVFNVGRHVVELRRGKEWPGLTEFKPKLLKFVIMLEQWPYRAPARPKGLPPAACCGHPCIAALSSSVSTDSTLLCQPKPCGLAGIPI